MLAFAVILLMPGSSLASSIRTLVQYDPRKIAVNTSEFPLNTIGQLQLCNSSGSCSKGYCTGALISADTVITAAHCLYNRGTGVHATAARFIPAYDPSATERAPYGSNAMLS